MHALPARSARAQLCDELHGDVRLVTTPTVGRPPKQPVVESRDGAGGSTPVPGARSAPGYPRSAETTRRVTARPATCGTAAPDTMQADDGPVKKYADGRAQVYILSGRQAPRTELRAEPLAAGVSLGSHAGMRARRAVSQRSDDA